MWQTADDELYVYSMLGLPLTVPAGVAAKAPGWVHVGKIAPPPPAFDPALVPEIPFFTVETESEADECGGSHTIRGFFALTAGQPPLTLDWSGDIAPSRPCPGPPPSA